MCRSDGHFRKGNAGRPVIYPWLTLEVGQGFCVPRRMIRCAMTKHASSMRDLARRQGIRVSVRTLAPGILVTRVA